MSSLRPPISSPDLLIHLGPLVFDPVHRRVWNGDVAIELTRLTSALLYLLSQSPNRPVPLTEIAGLWKRAAAPGSRRYADVAHRLRTSLATLGPQVTVASERRHSYTLRIM